MKKQYITPSLSTVTVHTTGMIAVSLYGGELGSRIDLDDSDDQFYDDTDGFLVGDGTIGIEDV